MFLTFYAATARHIYLPKDASNVRRFQAAGFILFEERSNYHTRGRMFLQLAD